jgi:SPFH domain/Band 7 family protein
MNGLAWLNELMTWLGRWVPRLVLIEPTHRGVRFGPRGGSRQMGPGLVGYWPITHSLVEIPVTTQSLQLCAQILPLDDSPGDIVPRVMVCAAALQFRVVHAVDAATKALHLHALVDNRAQALIAKHVAESNDLKKWGRLVAKDLRAELKPFGIQVERLDFTQRGIGVALKNISDWSYGDSAAGTRPKPE